MDELSGARSRDRTGSVRGVRPDGLHPRHHRPALSAVRGDHRDFGSALGVQRAHAQPGAGRAAAPATTVEPRTAAAVLRLVQSDVSNELPRATSRWSADSAPQERWSWWCCSSDLVSPPDSSADRVPSSFLPDEDQGFCLHQLAASQCGLAGAHRLRSPPKVEKILANTPGVEYSTSVVGFSLLSFVRTSYNAFFFVTLKPWDDRKTRAEQLQAIKVAPEPGAEPVAGSHRLQLLSAGHSRRRHLRRIHVHPRRPLGRRCAVPRQEPEHVFLDAARKRPEIASLSTTFLPSVPQEFVDVDRDKVLKQGVNLNDVYRTIQAFMGGYFINYFNRFGRQWQVYIEAEGEYRATRRKCRPVLCPQQQGRERTAVHADYCEAAPRAGIHHALQRIPVGANQWQRRPGL